MVFFSGFVLCLMSVLILRHLPVGLGILLGQSRNPMILQQKQMALLAFRNWLKQEWFPAVLVFVGYLGAAFWIRGGLLGCLARAIRNEPRSLGSFIDDAARFFGRQLSLGTLLIVCFGGYGGLFFGILMGIRKLIHRPSAALDILLLTAVILFSLSIAWFVVKVLLAAYAIVFDDVSMWEGLERGFDVTAGYWWRTMLIAFLPSLFLRGVLLLVGAMITNPLTVLSISILGYLLMMVFMMSLLMAFYSESVKE
jgi:CDP-diglyceride synthetase